MAGKQKKKIDPSKPLRNQRWERFCQLYAGKRLGNAKASYLGAGYKPRNKSSAEVEGWRLLRNVKVWERISFLREENLRYMEMDRLDAVDHLRKIIKAKVTDFMDEEGRVSVPKNHPLAEVVQEYVVEEKNGTVKARLKLKDSLKALDMIGLAEPRKIDHTSGGKPITTVIQFVDGNED